MISLYTLVLVLKSKYNFKCNSVTFDYLMMGNLYSFFGFGYQDGWYVIITFD